MPQGCPAGIIHRLRDQCLGMGPTQRGRRNARSCRQHLRRCEGRAVADKAQRLRPRPGLLRSRRTRRRLLAMLLGRDARRHDVGDRGPQLVRQPDTTSPSPFIIASKPALATSAGSSFFAVPTLVSIMSARSKNSVSVAPGIKHVTVTPIP